MVKQGRIFFILFLTGITILLVPDSAKPVIVFNKMHGPSILDLMGLSLMIMAWLAGCVVIVRKWPMIKNRLGQNATWTLFLLYILSIGQIILSLNLSINWLLWPGVIFASLINILFLLLVLGTKSK